MGFGEPLEAAYRLTAATAPIGAGTWHLIGDGFVYEPVDMRFDVRWRRGAIDGEEATLARFEHHFDPPAEGEGRFDAVPYEADARGVAADAQPGDFLVLRFEVRSSHPIGTRQYAPNGDGPLAKGRIPSLRLP